MKKIITLLLLVSFALSNAQAFKGKGDRKVNAGAVFQDGGTGIEASIDFGIGENLSYGFGTSYVIGVSAYNNDYKNFTDRYNAEFRLNANIGSVLKLDPKMDIYPGLNLNLYNFGGHVGFRYFFTEGFGVFTEVNFPIAKYNVDSFGGYYNQLTVNLGASFNI